MAFNRMRRRPMENGSIAQTIDVDGGWIAQGSLTISQWQPYLYGAVASVGNGLVASIQRVASGTFDVFFPPDYCGERIVDADATVVCGTAGFIASYDAYIGSYLPPAIASGSYTGATASNGRLRIYTVPKATASLSTLGDVSSLALASIRFWIRYSDADY